MIPGVIASSRRRVQPIAPVGISPSAAQVLLSSTAPTRDVSETQQLVFLSHFDGADAATSSVDKSPFAHTITFNGNAQLDTAQKKFGTASLLLDGTGDFISCANHSSFLFGTSQFTVEMFVRLANTSQTCTLAGVFLASAVEASWRLLFSADDLFFQYSVDGDNIITPIQVASGVSANTQHHVVVERGSVNKVRVYVDGVMIGSATVSASFFASDQPFTLGGDPDGNTTLNGHIDEARVSRGDAQYDSDGGYTVPTVPFPDGEYLPDAAQLIISGTAPAVNVGSGINLQPSAGQMLLSITAPSVSASENRTISPSSANVSLSSVAPDLGVYQTGFNETGHATNSGGWSTWGLRIVVPAMGISGTKLRLTMVGPTGGSEDMSIGNGYVGHGATTGNLSNFADGDQVQVLKSGSAAYTVARDTEVVTDEITYAYDGSKPLVVSIFVANNTSHDTIRRRDSGSTATTYNTGSGGADSSGTTAPNLPNSNSGRCAVLKKVEIFVP